MSSYFHKGYEHRNSGYGRRRHNSVGFRTSRRKMSVMSRIIIAMLCLLVAAAFVFVFIKYFGPFLKSVTSSEAETQDNALTETGDIPTGAFDKVDSKLYVSEGSGYQIFNGIDKTAVSYAAVLNSVAAGIDSDIDIYSMVIPTNTEIGLDERLRGDSSSQRANLDMINSRLMNRVKSIDVYTTLTAHKNEYIYFRTEDCWTALGAFYGYTAFANSSNYPSDKINTLENLSEYKGVVKNFAGSYIERTTDEMLQPDGNPELRAHLDTIEFYKLDVNYSCYIESDSDTDTDEQSGYPYYSETDTDNYGYYDDSAGDDSVELFSMSGLDNDPFAIFPGRNVPLMEIENHDEWDSSERLLLIKDDYANPMIGYLVNGYNEVHVVDTTLWKGNLNEYIDDNDITQVLFLSSITDANNSLYCQRLKDLFDSGITR